MPRRGENIRKRKDGRWEGRYITGYKPEGNAKYQSVYGGSYLEVKRKLLQTTGINKADALPGPCKRMCFREALFLWLESKKIKLRPQTYAKYAQMIENHLAESIGSQKLVSVTAASVNQFLEEKMTSGRLDGQGGLSISYVKTLIFIIRSSLDFAVQQQYCLPLCGDICELPKKKADFNVFTREEQMRLESHMQSDLNGTKLGILICLHTGLRVGEICGLKWSDIDFRQSTLSIQRTVFRMSNSNSGFDEPKTKLTVGEPKSLSSYRVIPVPTYLLPLLSECRKRSTSEWVIADNGCVPDPRTYQYRFKGYLKDCKISDRNFHALRHAFATRCIEVGVDIKSLSEMLGHASVNITLNTYVHSSLEQKRRQIELLSSIRGQNMGRTTVQTPDVISV